MSLNKKKVENFINDIIKENKPYYDSDIFEGLQVDVCYGSFGSCQISLEGKYRTEDKTGIYRYKDIENVIYNFIHNSQDRYLQKYYYEHKKAPLGNGGEFLENLYNYKAKSNCSYYEKKSNKGDLLIVFLGCSEFLIVNNYWGVVALGVRSFDFDTNKALYKVKEKGNHYTRGTLESIITAYENKKLRLYNLDVEFLGDDEQWKRERKQYTSVLIGTY